MKHIKIYLLSSLFLVASLPAKAQTSEPGAVFLNRGLMYVNNINENEEDKDAVITRMFIKGDMVAVEQSLIYVHNAEMKLTGDLINNVKNNYHVFAFNESEPDFTEKTNGWFTFAGDSEQRIRGIADKTQGYVYFPGTTCIDNHDSGDLKQSRVTLESNMGATMTTIVNKSGRFILDSQPGKDPFTTANANLILKNRQELVNLYDPSNPSRPWGNVQVNLAVGNDEAGRLFGFSSPYDTLYTDYFMFNFLSAPSPNGLFGDDGLLITNPEAKMKMGKGYIVGMGLVADKSYYENLLDPKYIRANYDQRAIEKYEFGSFPYKTNNTIQVVDTKTRNDGERLVTGNVEVQLEKGFNYIGNPYTAPLDLISLVYAKGSEAWNVSIGEKDTCQVKDCFYVITNGSGKYEGNNRFTFNVTYLIMQKTGGTYNEKMESTGPMVAPMQMFVVYANKECKMTIPANKRNHGGVSFLRSSGDDQPVDELLIQTSDTKTKGFDRLCVVFRDDATLRSDDHYDATKIFNRSGGVNQIYTRSADNKDMTTSVVSTETKKMTMYMEPAGEEQEVELTAERLASLQSVQQVVLEDTKTGKKTDLTQTPSYTFTSSPVDKADRFVLHFSPTGTDLIDTEMAASLSAYYEGGVITLQGLQDSDSGNSVYLYNIQGQLIHKDRVANIPVMQVHKALASGIYILRVEHNSQVIKLFVK